ncbi:HD-GYP domain-containing protein [Alsobacter sp. SYSU BS001988]
MQRFKSSSSTMTRAAPDGQPVGKVSSAGTPWSVAPRSSASLLCTVVGPPAVAAAAEKSPSAAPSGARFGGEDVLRRCLSGGAIASVTEIEEANAKLFQDIRRTGVADWVESVRRHHDGTFQHCMLVNGLVAAFVDRLGFSRRDVARAMLAATLHDIGKARTPVHILDSPLKLTPEEFAVMQRHPTDAIEMLAEGDPLDPAVLDAIEHHHEYLDGSGYPHGLCGSQVLDLTRLLTISDIFAALSERRSYKPPMAPDEAFRVLEDMGPKLDQALVKAFRPISEMLPPSTNT